MIALEKKNGTFVEPVKKTWAEIQRETRNEILSTPISKYIIFDFETTGLNPKTDRVIEIAALKIEDNNVIDKYTTLINPQKNITKKITELTGITTEMLMEAPLEQDIIEDFVNFINGMPCCAYNVSFDVSFLDAMLLRNNMGIKNFEYFDALKIAKEKIEGLENYKLQTVVKSIEPDFEQSHRAFDDCEAVYKILSHVGVLRKDIV